MVSKTDDPVGAYRDSADEPHDPGCVCWRCGGKYATADCGGPGVYSVAEDVRMDEKVNHPSHYTTHPSGVECITITEAFNFNVGNAIKYLWRAGLKGDAVEDLKKAEWYVKREIERLTKGKP